MMIFEYGDLGFCEFREIEFDWTWNSMNTSLDVNSRYKQTFYSNARDQMSNHSTNHVIR